VQAIADGKALGWDWFAPSTCTAAHRARPPDRRVWRARADDALYALKQYGKHTGLATLCLGGATQSPCQWR